jgi:hypothetical protein
MFHRKKGEGKLIPKAGDFADSKFDFLEIVEM